MLPLARAQAIVATLGLALLLTASAAPLRADDDDPLAPAREALVDGDWARAAALCREAADAGRGPRDQALLLLATALRADGKLAAADEALEAIEAITPPSSLRRKALFLRADDAARRGDFRTAIDLMARGASELSEPGRRDAVAGRLVDLADRLRLPDDESTPADHHGARELYLAAVDVGLAPERAVRARLLAARCDIDSGNPGRAAQILRDLLAPRPTPRGDAAPKLEGAQRREALLLRGCAELGAGRPDAARAALEDLIAEAPADDPLAPEAAYRLGRTFGLPGGTSEEALERGVAAWAKLRERFPDHRLADAAAVDTGRSLLAAARFDEAIAALERFLATPARGPGADDDRDGDGQPSSPTPPPLPFGPDGRAGDERPQARRLLGDALHRLRRHDEAIAVLERFLREHPTHRDWNAVRRRITDLEHVRGLAAHEEKRYADARAAFERFAERHPLDGRIPQTLLLVGEGLVEEKRYDDAVSAWARLASKYPTHGHAVDAVRRSAEVLEEELDAPDRAIAVLRRAVEQNGAAAGFARGRLASLTERALGITTDGITRGGDVPVVAVRARNVDALDLRIWRLDIEAYFRKVHAVSAVDGLDVDLVAPDVSREVKLDAGDAADAEHALIETKVALPEAKEPGAWVVVAGDDHVEAVTLVLVSDLEVIARAGPAGEAFIYVHDARRGAPAAEVAVLVSDGTRVVLEGKTDADGVFRALLPEDLAGGARLRALALGGETRGAASATLPPLHVARAAESVPRAFLFTDRPTYRAGDEVAIAGIIREPLSTADDDAGDAKLPANGGLGFEAGARYELVVVAPGGEVVTETTVALDGFGALARRVRLPATAPAGDWAIRISRQDGPSYATGFRVAAPAVGRPRIAISMPRGAWFRGEEVNGTARLIASYGEPLRGRRVLVRLGSRGDPAELVTDARGEVSFRFATREQNETAVVALTAEVPEEGIAGRANVYLATRGFELELETPRGVFLGGEPVEVRLATTDLSGEGVATELTVTAERLETIGGSEMVERVLERTLVTDADGHARASLSLEKPGRYRLRAKGRDRLGNQVGAIADVLVTGKDDEVVLRILSERQTVHPGERLEIPVFSRANAAGTALVTIETDRVVAHRTVKLAPGRQTIPIAIEPGFAPGFVLSIDLLTGAERHTARATFAVERDLALTVRAPTDAVLPGGEVTIDVIAKDRAGNPAKAAILVAVADAALFEGRDDEDPAAAFAPVMRASGLVAGSSAPWSYAGTTRLVPNEFLAERARAGAPRRLANDLRPDVESLRVVTGGTTVTDAYGVGGGAAGAYGQRWGRGSLNNKSKQGGRHQPTGKPQSYKGQSFGLAGELFFTSNVTASSSGEAARREAAPRAGAFVSGISTGADGRASVRVKLPEVPGVYRVLVVGASADTLVGAATTELTVRGPLTITIAAPSRLVRGDAVRIPVRVHGSTDAVRGGAVEVVVTASMGDEKWSSPAQRVQLDEAGEAVVHVPFKAERAGGAVLFTAKATGAQGASAADRASVAVAYAGRVTEIARARVFRDDGTLVLRLPEGEDLVHAEIELAVSRAIDAGLIERLLPSAWRTNLGHPSAVAGAILRTLAVARLHERMGGTKPKGLDGANARVAELVAALALTQGGDGGFGWRRDRRRSGGQADALSTVLAARAFAAAREAGVDRAAAPLERALAWLQARFQQTGDDAEKATLLFGLATSGDAGYAALNRLYRSRNALPRTALAYLTLALADSGRASEAAETARLLLGGNGDDSGARRPARDGLRDALGAAEADGVIALAIVRALPGSEAARGAASKAVARVAGCTRIGPWATLAIAHGVEPTPKDRDRLAVKITSPGGGLIRLEPGSSQVSGWFPLDPATLGDELTVTVDVDGSGEALVRARVVVAGRELPAKLRADADGPHAVNVRHQAAPLLYRWREVPRGFSTLRTPVKPWVNLAASLPVGRTATVAVGLDRRTERAPYMVIEAPIPAGCRVVDGSPSGNFEAIEVDHDRSLVRLSFGPGSSLPRASFDIVGAVPGSYSVPPARAFPWSEPERSVWGKAARLEVIDRGAKSADAYRPTPDELYHRGRMAFDDDDLARAATDLETLLTDYDLRDEPLREGARMLLYAALERDDATAVVRWFEVLKERYEDLVISFDDTRRVGEAYRKLGEAERGLQVFRGVTEALFMKESPVAGRIEAGGDLEGSVSFLTALADEYPDLEIVQTTLYQLAHTVYASADRQPAAPNAALNANEPGAAPAGPRRREAQIERAASLFASFLARYPTARIADEAAFSLLAAELDLAREGRTRPLARRLAKRFPESAWLDEYLYVEGLSSYEMGEHGRAIEVLARVGEGQFPVHGGAAGRTAFSGRRDAARFLKAQALHATGRLDDALAAYGEVRDRFADARAAIQHIEREELSLPEVSTFASGSDRPSLEVSSRNIEDAKLSVWQVDLMKLYLAEKSLEDVAGIHLAGIKPMLEREVHLAGPGSRGLARETEVVLPLDKAGAYLVVARGGDQFASGLVVVSGLDVEVAEDPRSGRVRVAVVSRGEKPKPISRAAVRVVGSGDGRVRAGETDPRGVYTASAVSGRATVIARVGDQFAFYRGRVRLGQVPQQQQEMQQQLRQLDRNFQDQTEGYYSNMGDQQGDMDALELNDQLRAEILGENFRNVESNRKALQSKYQKKTAGVAVEQAK